MKSLFVVMLLFLSLQLMANDHVNLANAEITSIEKVSADPNAPLEQSKLGITVALKMITRLWLFNSTRFAASAVA